ncbi:ATPase [Acetobacter nitrogenifigens DSM 23921 = NBRC 105050]|uniref:Protease associated ATPase ClpB n=1 Tax=Acetobacter nitrogenifigens DSM 23921 = NBRC 105050 TaxID=1120919 RepID=A0A511XBH4_9PROT|nr:type VI secretion system ATPase TssH [Acetobacter nitrogenifigens]GBQ90565.1 ATPase [Acetobacter nitrogenifigens DSM 23921 = NBRC 105050]GEN60314.1 protease associated ATPase ClpB [Acetobacter nitrogenifigens DSM 23921 = NBRC 105050]
MTVAIDLQKLIGRFDELCHRTLEAAAGAAMSRSHYNVEIEHWLLQLLRSEGSDLDLIVTRSDIDPGRLAAGLNHALDRLSTGNGRGPALSPDLVAVVKDAWLVASIDMGMAALRSGHLLCACLSDESIARRLHAACPDLRALLPDVVKRDFARLTEGGVERTSYALDGDAPEGGDAAGQPGRASATPSLDKFTTDLVARARAGRIDPILGRDAEIRQVVDILTRRRQNNPILTGEAGVGKTAVVEGLALRIAEGDIPEALADVSVRTLDLGLLQAGAGVKGEFENRLRAVIDEVQGSATPIILFIDEAHTLIGAGGQAGQGDAANLLKPPLARGELRVIAATTWAEYKKYIEKDAALVRRFQVVKVEEPSVPVATDMLRGLVPVLEKHHKVRILDEATAAAVSLSARYIPDRQLPDKAVSLIDTACARVAMSQSTTPALIEGRRRRLAAIEAERRMLEREGLSGSPHSARLEALAGEEAQLNDDLAQTEARWEKERELALKLAEAREKAETGVDGASAEEMREDALRAAEELRAIQGEHPMVFPMVDAQAVAEIVENWTGIPAGRMRSDEVEAILHLEARLQERVVGQDHALHAVAEAIRVSRAGLTDPRKPVGVFLMVGTSGVGKTETATALADLLYGGSQSLTTINMTEFKEEHKVSLLMGSPPGYVGYGEGGVLTEAVRRRPHSVLLLDELEKAHPGVQDVFFQVFDKGAMKDGEGRDIDFRNTIIIMTTNAGTGLIDTLFSDPDTAPDAAGLAEALREEMLKHFKAAFLGRVTMVPYLPLGPDTLAKIVTLQLDKVVRRVAQVHGVALSISEAVREELLRQSGVSASGARAIEQTIAGRILPTLSRLLLVRARNDSASHATLDWRDGEYVAVLKDVVPA